MAQVFTAVTFGAEGFRRTFVVKRLRAELSREPAVVAQFIDEAKLGSTLVHSNVIPVFDFGKVGDEYFLAQEYILGRDMGRVTAALDRAAAAPGLGDHGPLRRRSRRCWRSSTRTPSWATTAARWGSSTATSRPATSCSRRAAR